ncbi:MAG: ABC1 kinase family protein, partial [Bdellovibrionota bacterium]
MKAAQLASFLAFGFPQELRDLLSEFQANCPPMSSESVARVVTEEFGKPPEQVFSEWSPKPFASASIGQLHEALLPTGERVAVKVQYPGILKKLQSNFKVLSFLDQLATIAGFGNQPLLHELNTKLLNECDYELEAANMERFREFFANDPQIEIPRAFPKFTRKRVLTMELADGLTYREFQAGASQSEKNLAGETILRFHSEAILRLGLMNADPHPGNYLFNQGRVVFLDFGRVAEIDEKTLSLQRKFWSAILHRDAAAAKQMMKELKMVRNWAKFDFDEFWNVALEQHSHLMTDGPFQFTPEFLRRFWKLAQSYSQKRNLEFNPGFFWSVYINAGIWSLLGELRAESNWR